MLVLGRDGHAFYRSIVEELQLQARTRFEESVPDALYFYAAADLHVGPSLKDAFNLPILETMACGLPVTASVQAGASQLIHDSRAGFLLRDPRDPLLLAQLIRRLYNDASECHKW